MQQRAVRIPLIDTLVAFERQSATLVNISRTGALLRVYAPLPPGRAGRLVLIHGHTTIEIEATVVRTVAEPQAGPHTQGELEIGIQFTAPPPPEITALLRRVIALR